MPITLKTLADAKARLLDTKPSEPPTREDLEILFGVSKTKPIERDMFTLIDKWKTWIDSISNMGANISVGFQQVMETGLFLEAYQKLTVATATNSLTTLSQTATAFDWTDPGRTSKVLVPRASGVRNYPLLFDLVMTDVHTQQGMAFAKGENTLNFVYWDGAAFQDVNLDAGWEVTLWQLVPAVMTELP